MASDKHLAKLKEGAEAWNNWRQSQPAVRPDLQGLSLTLGQKQWGDTNGGPINLANALLRDANLRHATLIGSDLSAASLSGANLTGARLQHANLRNANLCNARFDDADLGGAVLDGANLSGADLRSARNLDASQIKAARGDAKTLLPLKLARPQSWVNGAETHAPAPRQAPAAAAPSTWTGTFTKPPDRQLASADAPRTSWASAFAKSAAVPAAAARTSITSAVAKSAAVPAAAAVSAAAAARASLRSAVAKSAAAPAAAAASLAAAVRTSWASAFAKPTASAAAAPEVQNRSWVGALERSASVPAAGIPIETTGARWSIAGDSSGIGVAAARPRAWLRGLLRRIEALNPVPPVRARLATWRGAARARIAGFDPLSAIAARLASVSRAAASRTRAALFALGAPFASSWSKLRSSVALSRRPGLRVALAAGLVGVVVVLGIGRVLWTRHDIDAATLNENVPLSAEVPRAEDEAPQRVAISESKTSVAIEEVKGQQVQPLTKPGQQASALKSDAVPVGAIKPVEVKEQDAATLASETLPTQRVMNAGGGRTRVALAVTAEKIPGEPVKASDVREGSALAQAAPDGRGEIRQHGEIKTPVGVPDPVTPLVTAPPQPKTQPAPAPEPVAGEGAAPDTNKLSFAGQDLSGLQKPKPPTTVVEYLKVPTRTKEWVEIFIKKFYLSSAALKERDIRQIYSNPMDFFGEEKVGLDRVAQEKAEYYRTWPKRHYELVEGSIVIEWKSESVAEVMFLYDFDVSAPDKTPNSGRGRAKLTLDLTESPGRIIREDGEVIPTH